MTHFTLSFAVASLAAAGAAPTPLSPPSPPALVHMHDFAFAPRTLKVVAGTVVTIVNDDSEPHTARAVDGSFSSGGLDYRDSWQHAFTKPGTYAYFCELHPYMKGTIVVTRAAEHA